MTDTYAQDAALLVRAGALIAGGLLTDLMQEYPVLAEAHSPSFSQRWDLVFTAAAVSCGLLRLANEVPPHRLKELSAIPFDPARTDYPPASGTDSIARYLNAVRDTWFRDGERAAIHCTEFLMQRRSTVAPLDSQIETDSLIIGSWVLINMFDEPPDQPKSGVVSLKL